MESYKTQNNGKWGTEVTENIHTSSSEHHVTKSHTYQCDARVPHRYGL